MAEIKVISDLKEKIVNAPDSFESLCKIAAHEATEQNPVTFKYNNIRVIISIEPIN